MNRYSRYIISAICFLIIIIRLIIPDLRFDTISLILFGIAVLAVLIPDLNQIFQRAKKIKIWEVEVELDELNKSTEKVEKKITESNERPKGLGNTPPSHDFEYKITNDLPSEVLKISIEIEKTLREIYSITLKTQDKRPLAVSALIGTLREKKVIDQELTDLLRKFWIFRNNIVHSVSHNVTELEFMSFIDIGLRILKILKAIQGHLDEDDVARAIEGLH